MMATLSSRFTFISGTNPVSELRSRSARKRFMESIATGSSSSPRLQADSHGWWHTRPQIAGRGFSSLISFNASRYFPWAARAIYPWTEMWAGQVALQGDVPRFSIENAPGTAWAYLRNAARRSFISMSYSFLRTTGHTVAHSPQPVHFEMSMYLGF